MDKNPITLGALRGNTTLSAILVIIAMIASLAGALLVHMTPVFAGGPIAFYRGEVYAKDYQSYLSCSCDSGTATMNFENHDTIPLTLQGEGWKVGPLAPGAAGSATFTDPGTYPYVIAEYPSVGSNIIILNKNPEFLGVKMNGSNITSDSVTLTWPTAQDDGKIYGYKLYSFDGTEYNNETLIYDGPANVTSTTVKNLKPATKYSFMVEVIDQPGKRSGVTLSAAITTAGIVSNTPSTTPKVTPTPTKKAVSPTPTAATTVSATIAESPSPEPTPSPSPSVMQSVTVNNKSYDVGRKYIVRPVDLYISGKADPNTPVSILLHSDVRTYPAMTDEAGSWSVRINTADIAIGDHELTASYVLNGQSVDNQVLLRFTKPRDYSLLYISLGVGAIVASVVVGALVIRERKRKRHERHSHHAAGHSHSH